jgi:endo-beta-N-acetylglucosaminidase D
MGSGNTFKASEKLEATAVTVSSTAPTECRLQAMARYLSISQKKKEIALESNGKKNSIKSRKMREDIVAQEEDNNDSVQLVRSTIALNSKDPFPIVDFSTIKR